MLPRLVLNSWPQVTSPHLSFPALWEAKASRSLEGLAVLARLEYSDMITGSLETSGLWQSSYLSLLSSWDH
ncbi:hypothetical protein AAY473_013692, partial [Plecturocebus cupreus]